MKQIPVLLLGAGGVGSELIRQIVATRDSVAQRNQTRFSVVAVADSRSSLIDRAGLDDQRLLESVEQKARGGSVGAQTEALAPIELLERAAAASLSQAIFVDVTAADGLEPALDLALELGYGVVTANKKALAGPWATAQRYFEEPRFRHESTVGGGQPVIATMRYLMDIDDRVLELGGQFSGSLGFICQQLDQGTSFSSALADAKQRGFTEPDPREDLGGKDALRKALILARMAGWPLETDDFAIESLYDESLAVIDLPEFLARSGELDAAMRRRVEEAATSGQVLRYLAKVTPEGGRVGLMPVAQSNPVANLKYVEYRTGYYDDEPLLICGKGAGVEMTAGGVLGDMIRLVREVF